MQVCLEADNIGPKDAKAVACKEWKKRGEKAGDLAAVLEQVSAGGTARAGRVPRR